MGAEERPPSAVQLEFSEQIAPRGRLIEREFPVKRKSKIWLIVVGVLVLAVVAVSAVNYGKSGIVEVQTGRVIRQDLASIVTASGEIKPRNYINIGTNAMMASRITEILVKEGERVHRGQLLARLESVQQEADVAAQQASVSSSDRKSVV
jgi:HlyD family secretion protein